MTEGEASKLQRDVCSMTSLLYPSPLIRIVLCTHAHTDARNSTAVESEGLGLVILYASVLPELQGYRLFLK